MHRREVLSIGMAGLAAGMGPAIWAWPMVGGDISNDAAIRLLSNTRRAAGLAMPDLDLELSETAQQQAMHMATLGVVSHFGPDGEDPPARARKVGFRGHVLGETLAETFDGPEETMAFWLSDSSTREVLMDPSAQSFGIAAIMGRDRRTWWDLVMGT